MSEARPLLQVKDLRTSFFTDDGEVPAVDGVSFHVNQGEVLGICWRKWMWEKCYILINYGSGSKPARKNCRWGNSL